MSLTFNLPSYESLLAELRNEFPNAEILAVEDQMIESIYPDLCGDPVINGVIVYRVKDEYDPTDWYSMCVRYSQTTEGIDISEEPLNEEGFETIDDAVEFVTASVRVFA